MKCERCSGHDRDHTELALRQKKPYTPRKIPEVTCECHIGKRTCYFCDDCAKWLQDMFKEAKIKRLNRAALSMLTWELSEEDAKIIEEARENGTAKPTYPPKELPNYET